MKKITITKKFLKEFCLYLQREEKSTATIEKYLRDVQSFRVYLSGAEVTKETVIAYI